MKQIVLSCFSVFLLLYSGRYLTSRSDAKRDMVCVLSCRYQQLQLSLKSSGQFLVPHI